MDWTRQLHAYVAWVNSQLRKKPGCRLVSDLRTDFQDGTTLANLIEIVSGTKLNGIDYNPKTVNNKRQNIDKVLQFMESKKMEAQFITAKDVNDGNLKSIMRLILAIAKQYKPTSVSLVRKPGELSTTTTTTTTTAPPGYGSLDNRRITGTNRIASPSSDHGLRVVVPSSDKYGGFGWNQQAAGFHNPNGCYVTSRSQSWNAYRRQKGIIPTGDTDGDYAGTDSDVSGHEPLKQTYRPRGGTSLNERLIDGGGEVDGASCMSSPAPSIAKQQLQSWLGTSMAPAKSLPCLQKCLNNADKPGYRDYENVPMYSTCISSTTDNLTTPNNKFLSGHPTENSNVRQNQGTNTTSGTSAEGKLVALQSYFQQTSEKCHDLHSNLQKAKRECANLEDIKCDLQTKVVDQDKCILEMKHEIAKLQIAKQSLEIEKGELLRSLHIKDEQLTELRRQLGGKDKLIHQQKNQFDDAIKNLSLANKACLTTRLADQDRKIALLEQARSQKTPMREELQVVHDALHSLRNGFRRNDPQHHTIDTLEQSFSLLMDRLHMADIQKMSNSQHDAKRLNFDSTGDPRRSPLTSYHGYALQKMDNADIGTKVVYFTEKTVTPFMSSIPKRLGEIHLRDFKTMFDRPGNYRFHFKSVDPEYGMVKEEILQDDDILPGWDGKIIAWVEEDHG